MDKILNGKLVSQSVKDQIKESILTNNYNYKLFVVSVGEDPASQVYVNNKKKSAEYCGIQFEHVKLPEETTQKELINIIYEIQNNKALSGIIVQLPLPKHINEQIILDLIEPRFDVDGFHPENMGKLVQGLPCFKSCTPYGVMQLLEYYNIDVEGKHCVVIGRSNMVGKPMAQMLTNANATVTLCHSKTKNLKEITKIADILVVAIGKKEFITSDYIKEGAVVIDVGIHRKEDGKLCGDVLQDEATLNKVSAITPVPGGVGPMTVVMLMKNCIQNPI